MSDAKVFIGGGRMYSQDELNVAVQVAHEHERARYEYIQRELEQWKKLVLDHKAMELPSPMIIKNGSIPSPCGQKFSDGTPHPLSCCKQVVSGSSGKQTTTPACTAEAMEGSTLTIEVVCLICQSEEKLRERCQSVSDELLTIAEGMGTTNMLRARQVQDCARRLASLLAPPPTARDANEKDLG